MATVVITGGLVKCIEGLRVWARLFDESEEVLILIVPRNSLKNENDCTEEGNS